MLNKNCTSINWSEIRPGPRGSGMVVNVFDRLFNRLPGLSLRYIQRTELDESGCEKGTLQVSALCGLKAILQGASTAYNYSAVNLNEGWRNKKLPM